MEIFADFHIHIGRTESGRPVKITGSKSLTLQNILKEAALVKGMNMIGIIDCHVPEVISELEGLVSDGTVVALEDGGLQFENLTLIPGCEIELYDKNCKGPVHVLVYLPNISKMKHFTNWLSARMKNITLSSQRIYEDAKTLQEKAKELGGLFIPAHIFTPFKSLYGKGVSKSLTEIFHPSLIDAVELGLSSDTQMADQIQELNRYPFLTNSDAHSVGKIAREYQKLELHASTYKEFKMALRNEGGRKILANYGLDPRLGKYHRTSCASCFSVIEPESANVCPACGETTLVKGVFDRLEELADSSGRQRERPPYFHQVPLEFIPGLGPKTLQKLLDHFGTEMAILHYVSERDLAEVVPKKIAETIGKARNGELKLRTGGAGKYGKVD
ncbi:TIGR00375 family protein [Pseudalkalibacillus caeni]|uniref:TIGR00375 family protein n=1 Tax=Exobacillus caeni TaxID=2574798 RepID=A0A5R9F2E4_9BACL|nr:TIGR00375 family protein [Pseudalkalibacillus caeni]TLS35668.1 TIGR00375 family protein [Pseudalkalibacillus caeni]